MTPVLDFDGVRRLLPQDPPFLFIDRVLELEPHRRIVCQKNVTGGEPYFAGHFPEAAVMPGALLGEAFAQAAILLLRLSEQRTGSNHGSEAADDRIFVVGSTRTRFLRPVVPGDVLLLTVEVEKMLSSSGMVRGYGEVDGRRVVQSTLTFSALSADSLREGTAARLDGPAEIGR